MAIDGEGNFYTARIFEPTADFDPGPRVFNMTPAGQRDVFIPKLDSAGTFIWSRQLGGVNFKESRGIAVQGSGSVYTTGSFVASVDFDPGAEAFSLTPPSAPPAEPRGFILPG